MQPSLSPSIAPSSLSTQQYQYWSPLSVVDGVVQEMAWVNEFTVEIPGII
jgi:hypothetical protein